MDVGKLFQGIAVIFDDELSTPTSTITTIKELIEKKNIPVVMYTEMPRQEIIPALSNASFVILDWDYKKKGLVYEGDERISIPSELKNEEDETLIKFIKTLLETIFIPVFIFTSKSTDSIKTNLKEAGLWDDNKQNRIFIKQKNDVKSETQLFGAIEEWLKAMPSVYVLKEWEKSISQSKNAMFRDLYGYSPNWVKIIWDMLKEDSIENHLVFGEFITRMLNNRVDTYTFNEKIINAQSDIQESELRRVIESERYIVYETQPEQAYTGDLFKTNGDYYLNIRAQCDISRSNHNSGEYNPELYCIKGKKLRKKDIVTDEIRITNQEELDFGAGKRFSLDGICEICKDEAQIEEFNRNFVRHRNSIFFRNGTFLGRNDKVIVGCVADEQVLQFDLAIYIKPFNDIKEARIGRILPPYITRIQQNCAQYIVREGTMPTPKELFSTFGE